MLFLHIPLFVGTTVLWETSSIRESNRAKVANLCRWKIETVGQEHLHSVAMMRWLIRVRPTPPSHIPSHVVKSIEVDCWGIQHVHDVRFLFFLLLFALLVFTIRHLQQFTIFDCELLSLRFDFYRFVVEFSCLSSLPLPQGVCDVTVDRNMFISHNSSNATDCTAMSSIPFNWHFCDDASWKEYTSGCWIRINMQQKKLYCLPHALYVCVRVWVYVNERSSVCLCVREKQRFVI